MALTDITWEEFETFKKVKTSDNLFIREHEGKFYTVFELGIASVRRIFDIRQEDFEAYLRGDRSADDILFRAQNDCWPPTEEEKKLIKKNFLLKHPASLINVPKNRELFSQEELEKLIPVAEQLWIESEGKLPDDYVSPLR